MSSVPIADIAPVICHDERGHQMRPPHGLACQDHDYRGRVGLTGFPPPPLFASLYISRQVVSSV
jgi:hypothetical protein